MESSVSQFNFLGLKLDVFRDVYPPQEDSFLLAKHTHSLSGNILELGTGCGISSLANASRNPENYVLGLDIDPKAVRNAEYNASHNKIRNARFIHSDLFSSAPILRFDAILFNPPYLPESHRPHGKPSPIDGALYSGRDGRFHTDSFLHHLDDYLLPGGKAFLIQSTHTDIPRTLELSHSLGFSSEVVEEKSFFFEKLALLKLFKE